MGVTWTKGSPTSFSGQGLRWSKEIELSVEAIVLDLANAGAELIREFIESTGGEGLPYAANPPGRIDTGTMRDAVSSEFHVEGKLYIATFGFTKEQEVYFLVQSGQVENHLWNGGVIKGAGYLVEAGDITFIQLLSALKAIL